MPRHARSVFFLLIALLTGVLTACGGEDAQDEKRTPTPEPLNSQWRLGLVTNVEGTISDGGFSESAHKGASRAAQEFNLVYTYALSKDEQDYEIQLDKQIADGRNVIVTVGYPMETVTYEYARQHPDVYFIGVDQSYAGQDIPANLIGLQFAEDEASFVVGALAGMMTQTNTLAVIGGIEIPPVVRLAEGFRNGAAYVNPDVSVLIVYTGSFSDSELGTRVAQDFIAQGADVIFGAAGLTGYAGIQYAAQKDVWVIGVDQDEWHTNFRAGSVTGSNRILTSAIKRVDNGVYQAIVSIVEGKATGGVVVLSTADCGVGYAPFHQTDSRIPAEAKQRMEAIWRALAAGTLQTGAGSTSTAPPDSLAPGALPEVPADAPKPGDCES